MTHDPEISLGLVAILEHPNEEDFAKLVELSGLDPKVASLIYLITISRGQILRVQR
jgi:hypothetical protein